MAKLLKGCPKGMELDCAIYNNTFLFSVDDYEDTAFPIKVAREDGFCFTLTKYGQCVDIDFAKCVIFPKGKTTWEGFHRPFEDGDIVFYDNYVSIFKEWGDETLFRNYVKVDIDSRRMLYSICDKTFSNGKSIKREARFATEEEKQKLFDVIKANGYHRNAEAKTLDKIEPKFKDGDVISSSLSICIFKGEGEIKGTVNYYCGLSRGILCIKNEKCDPESYYGYIADYRFATEEEKQKLFDVIKAKGYHWNAETKTLDKIEPKFKDGDILYCDANDYGENDDKFKYIFIFDKLEDGKYYYSHCHLGGGEFYDGKTFLVNNNYPVRFATEEEKEKLFKAIKDNGYKWNTKTKSLDKIEPKFKDGDVVVDDSGAVFIYRRIHPYYEEQYADFYCGLTSELRAFVIKMGEAQRCGKISSLRFATEEEKQELFQAIRERGYKWNTETKTLEKIEPKFKVGDRVVKKGGITVPVLITGVGEDYYYSNTENSVGFFSVKEQDDWELLVEPRFKVGDRIKLKKSALNNIYVVTKVNKDGSIIINDYVWTIKYEQLNNYELVHNKFDITTLKPYDKVLVRTKRHSFNPVWTIAFYDGYQPNIGGSFRPFGVANGEYFQQCIPYEGNEHLRGTTNDCDDYYKIWE